MGEEPIPKGNHKSGPHVKGDGAARLRDSKAAQKSVLKFQVKLDFNLTLPFLELCSKGRTLLMTIKQHIKTEASISITECTRSR